MARTPSGLSVIHQLLREWPPGYGGVERVAHELAVVWGGSVWSLDVQAQSQQHVDPLPVSYERIRLPTTPPLGRLSLPLPSGLLWRLLTDPQPLHGHLPSPGVLLLLISARMIRPGRRVTAHWHCFLEPSTDINGRLFAVYQWLALRVLPWLSGVITTSPLLRQELVHAGCREHRVQVLPCCLSAEQETAALDLSRREPVDHTPMGVLFIGRLDSYKRLDWLLKALATLEQPWHLAVVGDGPKRRLFEELSSDLFGREGLNRVTFLGRLSEQDKLGQLARADVLVLPSDRSNEAFGIVQLEAMAAGIPSLAFHRRRSGMGWVGQLPGLVWSQTSDGLPAVLQLLSVDRELCARLGQQARKRYCRHFARSVWLQQLSQLHRR